ncbi:hypothetical protein [Paenibacillus sp. FSL H8-0332]
MTRATQRVVELGRSDTGKHSGWWNWGGVTRASTAGGGTGAE